MQQRRSAGRPTGTDGLDFNYRMVVDSRYQRVTDGKSRLRNIILSQVEEGGEEGDVRAVRAGLVTILECAENPARYFAKVLRKAMKGLGTDDSTLVRVVVSRAEIDLQYVKVEYQKKYGKSLGDAVRSETSGSCRDFLLAIIGH